MKQRTRKLINKDDYPIGHPTFVDGEIRQLGKRDFSEHPYGIKKGFHLVQINSNTWVEVKDGEDDEKARKAFVAKMERSNQAFYNNLEVQMAKHTDL